MKETGQEDARKDGNHQKEREPPIARGAASPEIPQTDRAGAPKQRPNPPFHQSRLGETPGFSHGEEPSPSFPLR